MEALEAFRNDPDKYDLVITDQTMPRMSGTGLAEKIFAIRPGIPVILCTGYGDEATVNKAASLGIHNIVHKPYVLSELADAIRFALGDRESNDIVQ